MTSQEPEVTSNQQEDEIPLVSPRLKALVIWQGVAIIIGIIVVIGTLGYRAVNMISDMPDTQAKPEVSSGSTIIREFEVQSYTAPKDSKLQKVHAGDKVVTLEFLHLSGDTTLVFINVATGLETGRIFVKNTD